jgi:hypothetical protein
MFFDSQLMRNVVLYYLVSIVIVFVLFRRTARAPARQRRMMRSAVLAAFVGPGAILGVMSISPAPPIFALLVNLWTAFRYEQIGLVIPALFFSVVPFYLLWPMYYGLLGLFNRGPRVIRHNDELQPEAEAPQR